MKPITRKEYYLAKAGGTYTGPTPPPVLREDYYLATLAGDYPGNCPAPVTRLEKYMSAAAGLTTYVPQPVTRIEKYWYAIAKGTGYVPEPVTREEKFLYAVLKNPPKPEYLDKTAEGSMILLTDSAEAPFTALTVHGHSTQDGTPSPENPVPIVSAGDSGEINVTVGGAQLIQSENPISNQDIVVGDLQAGTYTLSFLSNSDWWTENINENNLFLENGDADITIMMQNTVVGERCYGTFTIEEPMADVIIHTYSNNIVSVISEIMLNSGSTALPYEPYKTPQTLTLSTPGGLPGIPVSSGGNYTDENGQQWVCDEIDLARGKYVHRVGKTVVDGTEIKFTADSTGGYWNLPLQSAPGISVQGIVISKYFPIGVFLGNERHSFLFTTPTLMSPYFSLVDELNAFCAEKYADGQPLEIYYIMAPSETDLPAEEIAAYKALHTYSPTTTVSNDAGAWMKVGYKAIP